MNGYEGKYEISNKGRVKSLRYHNTNEEKLLKIGTNEWNDLYVRLSKNNICKKYMVKVLVAKAFIPNPDNKPVVKNIKKRDDCRVENLKWDYDRDKNYEENKDLALKRGVTYHDFRNRTTRGWTVEEAITIRPSIKNRGKLPKVYKYYDKWETIKNLTEVAKVSKRQIYKRLKRGWNIYEAIEIPPMKKER